MPNPQNLKPFQKGQTGNPNGSSRRARARAQLHRMFGGREKVDAELLIVLFAKATGREYLLEELVKGDDGKPVIGKDGKPTKRQREPDLGFLRELKELSWGKDDAGPEATDVDEQPDAKPSISLPRVDERYRPKGRKHPRKARQPGGGGDVPEGASGQRAGRDGEDAPDPDVPASNPG